MSRALTPIELSPVRNVSNDANRDSRVMLKAIARAEAQLRLGAKMLGQCLRQCGVVLWAL